ncbi:MAG TPA: asparagine synthase (glutamine-hydrolyzing) [Terriglobia bacterium]|nr:asparagine synthase (glutamine-hydrolyzing) [Terriglobia bacterium]
MCGIFGQISLSPPAADHSAAIRHRGPDDSGSCTFAVSGTPQYVTLSHRRLAVIDLSPAGHQPMSNEDSTVWIVFNGEIYNFQELRSDLRASGHIFHSKTDTEAIIHGYEEWGEEVVKRLRGMFAFAIWDSRHKRLFLARDGVGKKPLFYSCDGRRLIFASEIKAILETGTVQASLDTDALHDYLTYLYFPPPKTAFRGISKLPPATSLSIQVLPDGSLKQRASTFWDPLKSPGSSARFSESEAIDRVRSLIDEAVRIRLVSDVPIGVFLSGGIDSSTITAFASQRSQSPVQTFSISFPDSKFYDELPAAKLVAEKFHTCHHVLQADADCVRHLTKVVRHFDEPFGNPTAVLESILAELMRQHVTVALSGDGGDEVFGGYVRYTGALLARHYRKLPSFVTRSLAPRLSALIREDTNGRHGFRRLREFAEYGWQPEEEMYLHWVGYFSEAEKQTLYTPYFARETAGCDSGTFLRSLFRRGAELDPTNRLGYVDLASFLACNCLEYSDRMSMAHSLEVRCPFADQRLIEFAFQLPGSMKVRGLETKWIVKRAMKGILPAEILQRKKMGFNPPASRWINRELRPLVATLLASKVVERRGIFRPDAVSRLIQDHMQGTRDNTLKIWALLMIELWQRLYLDHESESALFEDIAAATWKSKSSGEARIAATQVA